VAESAHGCGALSATMRCPCASLHAALRTLPKAGLLLPEEE
jgi:hypothetical protein